MLSLRTVASRRPYTEPMPLRLPRFRLRTLLIAIVVIGVAASRCELVNYNIGPTMKIHGAGNSFVAVVRPPKRRREAWLEFGYVDRAGWSHGFDALFSIRACPCCGKSWEWDGERYVDD